MSVRQKFFEALLTRGLKPYERWIVDSNLDLHAQELRAEFVRMLTEDGPTRDRRRRGFNQAIFDAERGFACFNGTDLGMVMEKFDKAAKNLGCKR